MGTYSNRNSNAKSNNHKSNIFTNNNRGHNNSNKLYLEVLCAICMTFGHWKICQKPDGFQPSHFKSLDCSPNGVNGSSSNFINDDNDNNEDGISFNMASSSCSSSKTNLKVNIGPLVEGSAPYPAIGFT